MYSQAIIYYSSDERQMEQIKKDIVLLHCTAAIKYMDMLKLNDHQKDYLIKSIAKDVSHRIK